MHLLSSQSQAWGQKSVGAFHLTIHDYTLRRAKIALKDKKKWTTIISCIFRSTKEVQIRISRSNENQFVIFVMNSEESNQRRAWAEEKD